MRNDPSTAAPDRLLTFNEITEANGDKSRTSTYTRLKEDPDFPRPIRRGRNVYFLESEFLAYLAKLAAQRDSQANTEMADRGKANAAKMIEGRSKKHGAA